MQDLSDIIRMDLTHRPKPANYSGRLFVEILVQALIDASKPEFRQDYEAAVRWIARDRGVFPLCCQALEQEETSFRLALLKSIKKGLRYGVQKRRRAYGGGSRSSTVSYLKVAERQ